MNKLWIWLEFFMKFVKPHGMSHVTEAADAAGRGTGRSQWDTFRQIPPRARSASYGSTGSHNNNLSRSSWAAICRRRGRECQGTAMTGCTRPAARHRRGRALISHQPMLTSATAAAAADKLLPSSCECHQHALN